MKRAIEYINFLLVGSLLFCLVSSVKNYDSDVLEVMRIMTREVNSSIPPIKDNIRILENKTKRESKKLLHDYEFLYNKIVLIRESYTNSKLSMLEPSALKPLMELDIYGQLKKLRKNESTCWLVINEIGLDEREIVIVRTDTTRAGTVVWENDKGILSKNRRKDIRELSVEGEVKVKIFLDDEYESGVFHRRTYKVENFRK